jgi:hypothetical protein
MVQSPFVVDIVVETAPPGVAVMFLMDWEAAQSAAVDQRRLAPSSHKWWITLWASMLIGAKVFFFASFRTSENLKVYDVTEFPCDSRDLIYHISSYFDVKARLPGSWFIATPQCLGECLVLGRKNFRSSLRIRSPSCDQLR